MNRKRVFGMVLVFILSFMLMVALSLPGFSMMVGTYSEKSFADPGGQTTLPQSSNTLGDLIINGATFFFRGKANIDVLASRLEASDIHERSFYELQTIVSDALENMKVARGYYQALNRMASTLPYNPAVIEQLRVFNYQSLVKECGLNMDVFNEVMSYLRVGNIRGAYARVSRYTDTIITILENVIKEIFFNGIPETTSIYRLNQECTNMHLFGHYISQTFKKIR